MTEGTTEAMGDNQDPNLILEEETVTVIVVKETDLGLALEKRKQDGRTLVPPVEAGREEPLLLLTKEALFLLIESLSKIQFQMRSLKSER